MGSIKEYPTLPSDNRCRILFSHRGGNWLRGSERVLMDVLAGLDKTRYVPIVWCNWKILSNALKGTGILVHVSPTIIPLNTNGRFGSPLTYYTQIRQAVDYIKKHRIDIIHCNNLESMQWMIPAAKIAKTPILCHIHMMYSLRSRCLFALHYSDYIVGCSKAVINGLNRDHYPSNRLKVIYNGVSVPAINSELKLKIRSELDLSRKDGVLAVVGTIEYLKGFDIAIDALSILHSHNWKTHLLIIGDGRDKDVLAAKVRSAGLREYVHFLGSRTRDDVINILSSCVDITLITSRYEALPLVALESQAVGVPVVAADVGGVSEAVKHQKSGLIVSKNIPQSIADAIEELLSSPVKRKEMGKIGQKLMQQYFTKKNMVDEFTKTYDMLRKKNRAQELGIKPRFLCLKALIQILVRYFLNN